MSVEGGHAQNCGENGFFRLMVLKWRCKAPKQGPRKMTKFICVGAPLLIFLFFWGAPGCRQNRVFQNGQIFAETTVNVVLNCRGCKTHFCTVGSEIGHVRSGNTMVPKHVVLNLHFFSHSPTRRQGKLFHFFCLFPS